MTFFEQKEKCIFRLQIRMLSQSPEVARFDLSSLKIILTAGGILSATIRMEAMERIPSLKYIREAYGMNFPPNLKKFQKVKDIQFSRQFRWLKNVSAVKTSTLNFPPNFKYVPKIEKYSNFTAPSNPLNFPRVFKLFFF